MKRMKNYRQTSNHMLRRGNAMIMVVGILVLLVIVATSYIVRTNSGRTTSVAVRKTMLRDDKSKAIAEMLADIIALQLFVREYDGTVQPALSDDDLLSYHPLALRYEADQTDINGDEILDNPYNFPPYHVIPFTNWPDPDPGNPADILLWPSGPGNPTGPTTGELAYEGNPLGNPGFGDNRALADNEPLRWTTTFGPGSDDAYSHWRHMSNIATANNGFRIVFGINDIGDNIFDIDDGNSDGIDFRIGTIIAGLNDLGKPYLGIPFEQWLAVKPAPLLGEPPDAVYDTGSGNAIFRDDFYSRWYDWFFDYENAYKDPTRIPPNFYDLSYVGLPQDEFIVDTDRHAVGTVLTDTDGDGFTDSFWMLAPTMTESGIRQIVAVRIIDNSAMLNVNVGTQFVHADQTTDSDKTRSVTPADLLLVGDINDGLYFPHLRLGYFDNPDHHETGRLYGDTTVGYDIDADTWDGTNASFLAQLGVLNNNNFPDQFTSAPDRLLYWQAAGSKPFDPGFAVTPFGLTEELELRAYHGQNSAWIVSRLERAIQANPFSSSGFQFLHANLGRHETSELLDQLDVRELLFDHRKRLTTYNGARNDIMPPWLWWRVDVPADVIALGLDAEDRFLAQRRTKLDLREMRNPTLLDGEFDLAGRLPDTLLHALTDGDNVKGNSYFGPYTSVTDPDYVNTRRAAAAYAANILEWSDDDKDYIDLETAAIPLPLLGVSIGDATDTRFLGMESQPFLLEAFIGQVYHSQGPIACEGVPGNGENYVTRDAEESTHIVVVQIANPYGASIDDMSQFSIRVFGQTFFLLTGSLGPSTEQEPRTTIVYSIPDKFAGDASFRTNWLDFLDLEIDDLQAGTVLLNATGDWTHDVAEFASSSDKAVELLRDVDGVQVVIDRIDDPNGMPSNNFRSQVVKLNQFPYLPPDADFNCALPVDDNFFNGIRIGNNDYFVVWARTGRVWGYDFDNNQQITANERAPRYVFSSKPDPDLPVQSYDGQDGLSIQTYKGNAYAAGQDPDASPWIERSYVDPSDANTNLMRKPTFFPTKTVYDEAGQAKYQPFNDPIPPNGTVHFADNGVKTTNDYFFPYSLQMLQKDDDFEQIGELLNVFMFGHELKFELIGGIKTYTGTTQTFSEFMIDKTITGEKERVNRLQVVPIKLTGMGGAGGAGIHSLGQVIGVGDPTNINDPLHSIPAIPAGARVLDAFVCDGPGINGTVGTDDYLGANGFSGKLTPGLINVNTAAQEVMRAIPHNSRLVHEVDLPINNPHVRIPEAIVRYRDRVGDPANLIDKLPAYGDRGADNFLEDIFTNTDLDDLRGERGFASIGELLLLERPVTIGLGTPGNLEPDDNYRISFAGRDPYQAVGIVESTQISIDLNDIRVSGITQPDDVAKDVEELNLLFAGMSNLLTTRSDVFTVYFRIRSFRQNPVGPDGGPVWDATDPEFIVDDSRYVMLVDRSEVNKPTDKPKILYLEKLAK
ncbi:MAG: hypothetical protein IH984_06275 [Planctomycetes bacterium]|nr:hypothetical protein [Planctomycetota bacterium]